MSSKVRIICMMAAAAVVLGVIFAGCYFSGVFPRGRDAKAPAGITLQQYEQVQRNMTKEKVEKILGKGTLDLQKGDESSPNHVAIYVWQGQKDGSRATIIFHGDRVASLSYLGLQ